MSHDRNDCLSLVYIKKWLTMSCLSTLKSVLICVRSTEHVIITAVRRRPCRFNVHYSVIQHFVFDKRQTTTPPLQLDCHNGMIIILHCHFNSVRCDQNRPHSHERVDWLCGFKDFLITAPSCPCASSISSINLPKDTTLRGGYVHQQGELNSCLFWSLCKDAVWALQTPIS